MTKILDANSSTLLTALSAKSKEFSGEVIKATDHAVKSIEAQGFTFTRTMMDNSEQIARLVNEASQNATTTVNRTLKELQDSTKAAIEQSRQTTSASVAEMLETHNMLRSDTTALFERLREANILLQEVLSGAHENMSTIENTLVTRVSEFVAHHERGLRAQRRDQQPGRSAHQRVPLRHQQGADRPRPACHRSSTRTAAIAGGGGRS